MCFDIDGCFAQLSMNDDQRKEYNLDFFFLERFVY